VGRTLEIRFMVPRDATDGERLTKPLEIEILQTLTRHKHKQSIELHGGD